MPLYIETGLLITPPSLHPKTAKFNAFWSYIAIKIICF